MLTYELIVNTVNRRLRKGLSFTDPTAVATDMLKDAKSTPNMTNMVSNGSMLVQSNISPGPVLSCPSRCRASRLVLLSVVGSLLLRVVMSIRLMTIGGRADPSEKNTALLTLYVMAGMNSRDIGRMEAVS